MAGNRSEAARKAWVTRKAGGGGSKRGTPSVGSFARKGSNSSSAARAHATRDFERLAATPSPGKKRAAARSAAASKAHVTRKAQASARVAASKPPAVKKAKRSRSSG